MILQLYLYCIPVNDIFYLLGRLHRNNTSLLIFVNNIWYDELHVHDLMNFRSMSELCCRWEILSFGFFGRRQESCIKYRHGVLNSTAARLQDPCLIDLEVRKVEFKWTAYNIPRLGGGPNYLWLASGITSIRM